MCTVSSLDVNRGNKQQLSSQESWKSNPTEVYPPIQATMSSDIGKHIQKQTELSNHIGCFVANL